MTTSSIGLVEGLTLIVLLATGFGLVWRVAQVEKGLSDRINIQSARTDALSNSHTAKIEIIELKMGHLEDKAELAINGLIEKINHNRARWEEENEKTRASVKELQGFLEKHHNFLPRN